MSTVLRVGAIFSVGDIYEFEGMIFEWHNYLGPSLCKKNGELSKRQFGAKSHEKIERWRRLTQKQKAKTLWNGLKARPQRRPCW